MANQVLCPHCKSSIAVTDKFCPHCGKKLEQAREAVQALKTVVCSGCGRVNSASNVVCEGCGSELEQKEQLRREEAHHSAKQTKKQGKKKTSPSAYIVAGFIALIAVFIVLELRNSPASHTHAPDAQTSTPAPEKNSPLLSEITMLESKVKADPKNADAILQLANNLHDAKFYPRAVEAYKNFLKLQPNNTDARVDLGICYFELKETDQAVKEIKTALRIDPKHQMAMFNLGIIHLSSGDLPEAKKWFQKCVDIDPASTAGVRAQELLLQH